MYLKQCVLNRFHVLLIWLKYPTEEKGKKGEMHVYYYNNNHDSDYFIWILVVFFTCFCLLDFPSGACVQCQHAPRLNRKSIVSFPLRKFDLGI